MATECDVAHAMKVSSQSRLAARSSVAVRAAPAVWKWA
jgi:hypothetical protein